MAKTEVLRQSIIFLILGVLVVLIYIVVLQNFIAYLIISLMLAYLAALFT